MDDEKLPEKRLRMFHPTHTFMNKVVTNFTAKELHEAIFVNGELVYEIPCLEESREYLKQNLDSLWDEYKRIMNPEDYPVDLSQKCWDNKMENIEEVKEKVAEMKE
jgi:nicotinate phosphoribosyltransferase